MKSLTGRDIVTKLYMFYNVTKIKNTPHIVNLITANCLFEYFLNLVNIRIFPSIFKMYILHVYILQEVLFNDYTPSLSPI